MRCALLRATVSVNMAVSLPPGSLTLESQLLSIMDALMKAAVAEISQLFSESSTSLRLHLTQSLRENERLRMRLKLMRSELFSLKLQTRAARPSSRFALTRAGSTPKPRAQARGNQAVSISVNMEERTVPPVNEKTSNMETSDVILIKDEDESDGCSAVVEPESLNTGIDIHMDMEKQQCVDVQSRVEEPLLNKGDTLLNASELPAFSSISNVPTFSHDSHLTLTESEPGTMGHNVGMAINSQFETLPIIQSVSSSMVAIGSGGEGSPSSSVSQLPKLVRTPNAKPLYCNVCRERFNSRSELSMHRASHTGDSPVTYTMCGKLFVSKNTLGIHMRIHTGEKPYVCLLCGKRFTQNGGLRIHLRTHSGEKPYTCLVCQTSFNNPSNLRRHMITHNDV